MPAVTDQHYDALLQLIYNQKTAYLDPKLDLIELTWDQFGHHFRFTGIAYQIRQENNLIGLCWVEKCQNRLILLGLIIRPEFQGQGIGSQALQWLEKHCPADCPILELQVHCSNSRARALYTRIGFREIAYDPNSGLFTMRKELRHLEAVCQLPGRVIPDKTLSGQ
jgi:ribosomal protein S18 acetylase RimI-like enzyme